MALAAAPLRSQVGAGLLLWLLLPLLGGCGVNTIPTLEEQVNGAWAQVQNQYQRRADLIPTLSRLSRASPSRSARCWSR